MCALIPGSCVCHSVGCAVRTSKHNWGARRTLQYHVELRHKTT